MVDVDGSPGPDYPSRRGIVSIVPPDRPDIKKEGTMTVTIECVADVMTSKYRF